MIPIVAYVAIGLFALSAAAIYFVFVSFAFGAGYEPTYRRAVEAMLRLAEVGPRDTVFDLGAGTGAIVFRAARVYRARAVGIEIEPVRVLWLRLRRAWGPLPDRVEIRWGNFFDVDLGSATVVATFLWGGAMARLRGKLERELRPGSRIVSHVHPIPGWTPVAHDAETDVYLYRWAGADAPVTDRGSGTTARP
ncbi:MAG TPA: class I SAM-dependent methyltransferase [Thermoplasmata archaeon]|nr:class I SAM-dependent methyltransferase [Thermoplasmata archaeon]